MINNNIKIILIITYIIKQFRIELYHLKLQNKKNKINILSIYPLKLFIYHKTIFLFRKLIMFKKNILNLFLIMDYY